jgi:hypothetical protein
MSFTISYDVENKIIRGKVTGKIDLNLLKQYTVEMDHAESVYRGIYFLSDYRDAQISFSVIELFELPEKHQHFLTTLGLQIFSFKRALLMNQKDLESANFYETVAQNRGQRVKVFTDESAAVKWLLH